MTIYNVLLIATFYWLAAAGMIWLGYWMGRNSTDRPVRSLENPKKTNQNQAAIDEPTYDLFQEAAYGPPGSNEPDKPTIVRR